MTDELESIEGMDEETAPEYQEMLERMEQGRRPRNWLKGRSDILCLSTSFVAIIAKEG